MPLKMFSMTAEKEEKMITKITEFKLFKGFQEGKILMKSFRGWITGLLLLSLLLMPLQAFADEKGKIKIGFLAPATGMHAQVGKDMIDGAKMFLDEIKYRMAGREVVFLFEDDQATPAVSLSKSRKLVEMDKIDVLAGVLMASSGYAVAPYLDSKKVPMTFPVVAADDLTQRKRAKWLVRLGFTSSQSTHPFGEYAYKVLGYRRVAAICTDYALGWETLGGFQKTFEESGGKVIQKIWCPTTTSDFSPYLSLIRKDADAVFALFGGRLAVQFMKQYQESGLKDKIPLIGGGPLTDESILPALGDEALGVITPCHYSGALDNPVNREFVKKYRDKYGKVPSYFSESSYTTMRWINEAVKSLNGNISDANKFMQALKSIRLEGLPRGPMRLDAYENPVQNIYIRKVERKGKELQNVVIMTYNEVSQFWKYKPEDYLKMPVYSRDYPPLQK